MRPARSLLHLMVALAVLLCGLHIGEPAHAEDGAGAHAVTHAVSDADHDADEAPDADEAALHPLGLLGEIAVGPARLFVNAENILDVRQTKSDPLVRPFRANDGRWTVDAWAPTEGFVLNGGVRLRFGGTAH